MAGEVVAVVGADLRDRGEAEDGEQGAHHQLGAARAR